MPQAQIVSIGGRRLRTNRRGGAPEVTTDCDGGLFRAFLAGPGHTLMDAFASLDRAPGIQMLIQHPQRRLVGARVAVRPDEGDGSWEFTKVGDDIYVVVGNFA